MQVEPVGRVRRHLVLVAAVGLCIGLTVMAAAPALAAPVSIETHRISEASPFSPTSACAQANPGFSQGFAQETSVAVNPRDPRHILVSWIQDGRATDTVMASRDGGRTFARILVPGISACTGGDFQVSSDPGVEFSADGRMAYFSSIAVNNPATEEEAETGMLVNRSFDDGFSWTTPSTIQPPTGQFWDLPRLTPDPHHPKRAYYVYDLRKPPGFYSGYSLISTTTNRGRTWSQPRVLYDPQTSNSWPGITKILVNDDGSLLAVFALVATDPNNAAAGNATKELAIRSVDGGRTWTKPIRIGTSSGVGVTDPVSGHFLNTFDTYPSQTVAPNGDVYVSWLEPGGTDAETKIAVARSTDAGRHWRVRRLAVKGQAAMPTVQVAGDGTVGVVHYVIAAKSSNGFWPARTAVALSSDHGRHWSRHAIAGPFNLLTAGSNARPCCFLGDYEGVGRLPHGLVAALPMAKPIAKNNVDVYFSRITTSRPK